MATAQAQSLNAQSAVACLTLGEANTAKLSQTAATNELLFALNVAQKWKKSDPCRRVYEKKDRFAQKFKSVT